MTSKALDSSLPIGLVAGGGAMPFAVADSLVGRGFHPVLFALRGACDPVAVERFRHHWISVGQIGRAVRSVSHREAAAIWFSLARWFVRRCRKSRLDWGTVRVLRHVSFRRFAAATIICCRASADILEQDGFRMVGIKDVAPDLLMPLGCITRKAPDEHSPSLISQKGARCCAALESFRHRSGRRL